ncbi:spindle and kinetochore-associated protein 3 [Corythoichthys intestinalis]|uniref:spindle and kinetochore-associated protein 3 n=1 Tax=Corythoichthys intestinalis TaxID=161448 RepID=UPI0025A4E0FB|nr:spindle and kinetochore-associated protein 3 [Corythoichthys intestinalis]XP_061799521.1 spindle and kinetochore-associated protein 3-like [Nerophis lumbriciformis]
MDPTKEFFAKLKKLCGTLETETARLQQTFESRHESVDSDVGAKAKQAYHDINCETLDLKSQLKESLRKQKLHKKDVETLIHTFRAVESTVTHDVRAVTELFEKYGYQVPTGSRTPNAEGEKLEDKESGENEPEGEGGQHKEEEEKEGGSRPTSPPQGVPSPDSAAHMCTPKLSDFGLCELQLRQKLFGCSQLPAMPEIHLPRVNMRTPLPPSLKCALLKDEDELQMPQLMDFGISEDTLCLKNDFTMDLFRKKANKNCRPAENQPVINVIDILKEDSLVSPEPPVFCTPGLQIKKRNGHCSPPPQGGDHTQLLSAAPKPITIPEVPAFQTPFLKRMLSSKKHEPTVAKNDHSNFILHSETPHDGCVRDGRPWEYDVPECNITGVHPMPLTPDLKSTLDNTPRTYSDGATQDYYLSPPRCMGEPHEIGTPEMPELSSVTQDICNLVLQSQKRTVPQSRCMTTVSEHEFRSLSAFLKQMTLNDLNQAIFSINNYLAQSPGEDTREFGLEDLKIMTNAGITAPVYILCLSALRRLEHIRGERNNAVYKLNLHS